ncbi:MAG TPA: hypothetical protein PLV45_14000, partial [bacterium]|nr:hypothetical protein [bacterium]
MSIFSVHADEFYFHPQVIIVDNDADNRLPPKVLSNNIGELFIGWREMNDIGGETDLRIMSAYSPDQGSIWYDPVQVDNNLEFMPGLKVDFGSGNDENTICAVFTIHESQNIWASVSYDFGQTWPV